ncbi:LacI family transcriptional regulator [Marinomonas sp. C2222]|uniref:LacI family transcriptional regulator n=1 Tax=Marinomonas sargassi TaxID=2984494 RepID=A0ABT2YNZ2_9GAMM|nr:LacI family DNA-binding transcriptional regulator [Marinomonas sargassi]MCV2401605.1 LacI family transcriptional regulator [Marinomonas sargassi]
MPKKQTKHFTTISDVAKHAKVGKTSVSRYLNGEQDKLSKELREKISKAIEQLDFRPNHSARMLRAGHSKLIGLMFADVTNPYSIDVLKGIEQVCRKEGYMLMVCNTDNEKSLQDNYLSILEAHRVDGIIMNVAGMAAKQIENLSKLTSPVVLVDRIHPSLAFDSVGLDNKAAVFAACEHLQSKAYEAILVVTESLVIEPRRARIEAIHSFAEQHPHIDFETVEVENMSSQANSKIIEDFMGRHPNRKKAIFTTNGVTTMMVAKVLKSLNIKVGSEIGLIGIDDPEWAQLFEGGITVIRQPTQDIGQTACNRLLSRILGNAEAPQQIQLPAELVVRDST